MHNVSLSFQKWFICGKYIGSAKQLLKNTDWLLQFQLLTYNYYILVTPSASRGIVPLLISFAFHIKGMYASWDAASG